MLTRLNNQRTLSILVGGLGGFISWIFIEPLIAPRLGFASSFGALLGLDAAFGALAGICIGAALGVGSGLLARSRYQAQRGAQIGALAGIIGGAIGLVIGEIVYQPIQFIPFVGRAIGWAVFGAFVGAAQGITRRSWAGLRSAALGGIIGGAVGGFAFDLVGFITQLVFGSDGLSRGVALTILGACIGLWIVVIEQRLAPAILKVISGQMEGREFVLDKPLLTLGSDERGDVGIFGDAQVRPHHATLRHVDNGYTIESEGGSPLNVNRQPVTSQSLSHEDEVLIGQTRLIYRQKEGAKATFAPVTLAASAPMASTPSGQLWLVEQTSGRRHALQNFPVHIGRAPDNQIVLDHPTISGYHATIENEAGRLVLYDKNSSNGVFVNGRRIVGSNMIRAGWQVQLGDVVFTVADR